ncbi:MAG: D-alanyl-D-alanine carboxypeptidase/D-alanyl-D-alanine-endopeptidase [Ignavibacteriales bacterium]|nr:D-alanyl-D-alanine carboxypeptidase/D-alanyl-D-alanine-endopeptidase [Ignavibacteriales bacterium]
MKARKFINYLILFYFISTVIFPQTAKDIQNKVKELSKNELFKNAGWSVTAKYVDNGSIIISHNSGLSLAPASGLKLFTSATALAILGEDFRFETKLYYDGKITDGVLKGNIYVVGGGDPTLGSDLVSGSLPLDEVMKIWTNKIKAFGISEIQGAILADDFMFDREPIPDNWFWVDIGNYYGAPTSALTINNNLYYLVFQPGKDVGDKAKVLKTEPKIDGLTFINYMKTGKKGSGDNGYIYCAPSSEIATLRGSVPAGVDEFSIKGSIPNPPLFAVQHLRKHLINSGIKVKEEAKVLSSAPDYKKLKLITKILSPKLKDIIYIVNKLSNNLYTEQILKTISWYESGDGSTYDGIKVIREFLLSNKISTDGFHLYDGCGLSRSDAITTNMMVDLLIVLTKKKYFDTFYNSLGVMGDPEDISFYGKYGIGTELEKNVRIKSGTIEGVRSYSGYLKNKSGRMIAFSMIANNYTGSGADVQAMHRDILLELAKL